MMAITVTNVNIVSMRLLYDLKPPLSLTCCILCTVSCLNNCSYPNGNCLPSGLCNCSVYYSPYNNTIPYVAWAGDDCSFFTPYTAGSVARPTLVNIILPIVAAYYLFSAASLR